MISVPNHLVRIVVWWCIIKTYTGENPFHCDKCPKSFGQDSNLKIHRRTHTGKNFFLVISVLCHLVIIVIWRCIWEPIMVKNLFLVISFPNYFVKIVIWKYTENPYWRKPFPCNQCPKSFGHNNSWKVHKRAHFREKLFFLWSMYQIIF